MFDTITELFLSTYFLFDAVAGKIIGNSQLLFEKLYAAFLLPQSKCAALFSATQNEVVREIESYADYAQTCRIQKFTELSGIDSCISSEYVKMVAVKGEALKKIKQFGLEEYAEGTEATVYRFLCDTANMGYVSSLCLLGFLQCEGIFVAKNEALGKKNLGKAAVWNSVEGILLSLVYNKNSRQENLNRLHTAILGTIYEKLSNAAQSAYALEEARIVPESKLLTKAFGAEILKSDVYTAQYARFIFSNVISFKDKERALFSGHKEAIAATADLPLKLTCDKPVFDLKALEDLPLIREQELSQIGSIISGADACTDSTYRPLCVCTDSEYLSLAYGEAIGKVFPIANVEIIDVADLSEYDFEPTMNNIFVRSCDEDRQNVFVLLCKGEIREGILNSVKNFLKTDKRSKFRLQHPSALINLSAVLPVCICDKQNALQLKSYCDVVTLAQVNETEKSDMLFFISRKKAEKYNVVDLHVDASAQAMLMSYSIDKAESLLDCVTRYNRGRASVTVTAEKLKELIGGIVNKNKYGFGGAGNEAK